jgi:uncharacterized membrane protein YbhN (UPF0104 family)
MTSQTKQRIFFAAKLGLGAACLVWALSTIRPSTWALAASHVSWLWLMLAAWTLNQVFCALRLRVLLSIFGYRLGVADTMRIAFASHFVSSVLPGLVMGDVAKIAILRFATKDSGIGELTMVTLLDRLFGLLSLWAVAFVLSFVVVLPETVVAQSVVWLLRISVVIPVLCLAFLLFVASPHSAWLSKGLTGRAAFLAQRARSIVRKLTLRRSLAAILTQVIPFSMIAVVFLVAGQAATGGLISASLGESRAYIEQSFLAPTSIFVSTIPIAPAGIGVGQLTLAGIYQIAGLNPEVAVLLTTVVQISQLVVGCTIGLACFVFVKRHSGRLPDTVGQTATVRSAVESI